MEYTALTHAYAVSKWRTHASHQRMPHRGAQPLYEACLSGVCIFEDAYAT